MNLDNLKAKTESTFISEPPVIGSEEHEQIIAEVPEQKFQHYRSSRISTRLVATKGKKIVFTGFQYITKDPDIIEYLNFEISQGLPGITKGELLTEKEADPMEALKKRIIQEHEDEKAQEAADKARGITKDMGTSKAKGSPSINPMSSNQVAN